MLLCPIVTAGGGHSRPMFRTRLVARAEFYAVSTAWQRLPPPPPTPPLHQSKNAICAVLSRAAWFQEQSVCVHGDARLGGALRVWVKASEMSDVKTVDCGGDLLQKIKTDHTEVLLPFFCSVL